MEFNFKGPKISVTIIQIISIALCIAILIISRKIDDDNELSMSLSEEFIINFQEGFYTSFKSCNSPYNSTNLQNILTLNHLSFGSWQGTRRGCGYTKNNKKKVRRLKDGEKCGDNEEFLDKIPQQEIYSYKGISLCGTTKGNYYKLLQDGSIIKKSENCPEGKKSCGYIDTIQNKLCINNDEECPVNYIKISDKEPEGIENLKEISFDNTNMKFYYSNNPYEKTCETPYIQYTFKIADSFICTLPNLYYSSITLYELDAFKEESSTNCVSEDYSQDIPKEKSLRYHSLDRINNYKLYEENKIIDKIQNSKLIDYGYNVNNYKDHMLNLYVRTHFGFDKDCLEKTNFKMENLYNFQKKADKMNTWSVWMYALIATMVSSLLEFFTFFPNNGNKVILELFLKYFVIIVTSVYLVIYSYKALDFDDSFEEKMDCSDAITNSNYNIMIEKLRKSGKFIFWAFILLIIVVSINLICLVIRIYTLCKQTSLKPNDEKGDSLIEVKKINENEGNKNENMNEDNKGNIDNEKKDLNSINNFEKRNINKRLSSDMTDDDC